jgi:hypothetical protein
MINFHDFFFEKYVIGLIEDVYIDGLGKISSKIDSGNGAYNVIHGEDIQIDKKQKLVRFTTVNAVSLEKDLIDEIVINVGAGKSEARPVVNFDIKVGDRIFKNVPFSVGNRSSNKQKILIGKDFIQKSLDALIDVSLSNVADKNIEIEL